VSAVRETSVIFAALIGVYWLGEGPAQRRLVAASVVALGVIILALS
jgi:drug/metabolite transporter (DMT)-like permease